MACGKRSPLSNTPLNPPFLGSKMLKKPHFYKNPHFYKKLRFLGVWRAFLHIRNVPFRKCLHCAGSRKDLDGHNIGPGIQKVTSGLAVLRTWGFIREVCANTHPGALGNAFLPSGRAHRMECISLIRGRLLCSCKKALLQGNQQ